MNNKNNFRNSPAEGNAISTGSKVGKALATWLYFSLITVVLAIISTIPMPESLNEIPHLDKVGHFGYFALISALLVRQLRWWQTIVITCAMAAGVELLQEFIPWRTSSVNDFIAGAIGVIIAVALYKWKPYRKLINFRIW